MEEIYNYNRLHIQFHNCCCTKHTLVQLSTIIQTLYKPVIIITKFYKRQLMHLHIKDITLRSENVECHSHNNKWNCWTQSKTYVSKTSCHICSWGLDQNEPVHECACWSLIRIICTDFEFNCKVKQSFRLLLTKSFSKNNRSYLCTDTSK